MKGLALGRGGLLGLMATKGAAVVAIGAAVGTGSVVLAAHQMATPPGSTHGAAVVNAVRVTCAQFKPAPRGDSSTPPTAAPSPGAFGRCVSQVARANRGAEVAASGHGRSGSHRPVGDVGKPAGDGPPSWAKGRGRGPAGGSVPPNSSNS